MPKISIVISDYTYWKLLGCGNSFIHHTKGVNGLLERKPKKEFHYHDTIRVQVIT